MAKFKGSWALQGGNRRGLAIAAGKPRPGRPGLLRQYLAGRHRKVADSSGTDSAWEKRSGAPAPNLVSSATFLFARYNPGIAGVGGERPPAAKRRRR